MTRLVTVPVHGNPHKTARMQDGATVGATLGRDFYSEDGTVLTLASLRTALDIPPSNSGLSKTTWQLILDIPPNVTALADTATTGLYVVTGAGTSATRSFEVGASSAVSVTITNPDGVAGAPMFILDPTLNALSPNNWVANAMPLGTGPDTMTQLAIAANTFPARGSTGNVGAKAITDGALSALAGTGGTAGVLRGDGTVSSDLTGGFSVDTDTLFVDATNDRVGVNTATPQREMHIVGVNGPVGSFPTGPGAATSLIIENNGNCSLSTVFAVGSSSSFSGYVSGASVAAFSFTYSDSAGTWTFAVGTGNPFVLQSDRATLTRAEYQTGIQTVNLTGNTDNLTINSTTRELRITSTGAYNLTGMTGGGSGRQIRIVNTSAFAITLSHDVTSTAANRFFCPGSVGFVVTANGGIENSYDASSSRWRVIGV